jgi:hypothetical protein
MRAPAEQRSVHAWRISVRLNYKNVTFGYSRYMISADFCMKEYPNSMVANEPLWQRPKPNE